jgi:hypothetical protein
MANKKSRGRRVRGPDGKLYTKEQLATVVNVDSSDESSTTKIKTEGAVERELKNKNTVQEKTSSKEKDSAPSIIVSYINSSGQRVTKTFQCDSIRLFEGKNQKLTKSGLQTTVDITIEASVIEVI